MPLHDAYARLTPYELALPSEEFAEERFRRVQEEAESQGFPGHLEDIRAFALLGEVGAILQEIRPPDDPPEMIDQYGLLLFHLFHFWRGGFPLCLVRVPVARAAVTATSADPVELPGSGSVYLQLPQHLFWVPGDPNPESLDGIFATWHEGSLDAMAVAGVGEKRGGLISLPLPPLPLDELGPLLGQSMRPDAEEEDFSTEMPGAEIDDLYGVQSAGEVLKLLAALLPRLDEAEGGTVVEDAGTPAPSELDFRVI